MRSLGLGLIVAGAVLQPLGAQVRDTIRVRDTTRVRDTLKVPIPAKGDTLLQELTAGKGPPPPVVRDSIKDPLAHSELPADVTIERTVRWTRDSLFATGALTLADLLENVPGVGVFHAGWISAPATAAYMGAFRHVRVFIDGMELRVLDPRAGGVIDLTQVNLWAAEDVSIEQTATEIRIHMRTWRARITTPVTRTDIATGDQQTNLYRGFLARRWDNGAAFQFGAQQYGTTPPSSFGNSSDQLGLVGRLGWAGKRWSVDAFMSRNSRHRGVIIDDENPSDSIPSVESSRTDAYVRGGYGDPDTSRVWGQVIASASKYNWIGNRTFSFANPQNAEDSALTFSSLDTSEYRSQYIASAGSVLGPIRASVSGRMFIGGGSNIFTPSVRASYSLPWGAVSAFAEGKAYDSVARADITARLTPISFVSVLGSFGQFRDERSADSTISTAYTRGEIGLRLKNLWVVAGLMRRGSQRLAPPIEYDTNFTARIDGPATAITAGLRGQLWRLIHTDVSLLQWTDSVGFYRPQFQTRSELSVRTRLLDKFPSGNFGLTFAAVHEYRSAITFPVGVTSFEKADGYRTISTLLEIRILTATVSWQFRNILGERYRQVPFFVAPRQTNFYGVRWEFFN